MAVRNDYGVVGMNTAQIKTLQTSIGVKADGAWGKVSQAALDAAYGKNADPYTVYTGMQKTDAAGGGSQMTPLTGAAPGGYTGNAYLGANGDAYTSYGALLRDDGFEYPEGATISPNGMYYDIGNGWQFAKKANVFDEYGNVTGLADNSVTGLAPGTAVPGFERIPLAAATAASITGGTGTSGAAGGAEDGQDSDAWQAYLDKEVKKYVDELYAGYTS